MNKNIVRVGFIVIEGVVLAGCGDASETGAIDTDASESSSTASTGEVATFDDPEPASGGGSDDAGGGGGDDCEQIEADAVGMLDLYCAGCHSPGGNPATSFEDVTDLAQLVVDGRIVPGDAAGSPLFARITQGQMPPPAAPAFPDDQSIESLRRWIDDCAAAAPCTPDHVIETAWTLGVMRDDIANTTVIPVEERQFIRYFTLGHLYNQGLCGEELDPYRFALAKSVNSLSNGAQVVPPVAIDADQTIFRIDLRDYDWDLFLWDSIVAQSPYAIAYRQQEAIDLASFTQAAVPMLRGDWFAAVATQPPLYHEILKMPDSRGALESLLGISVDANIEANDVLRSGFLESGVSVSNRLIERHEVPAAGSRSYWLSYDFASNAGDGNIFAKPLDFVASGNEMIFSLPNGLHAYMIADAFGTRLDEAPDEIVTDAGQPDQNVINGLSCFRCHSDGILEREDELRAHVAASFEFDDVTKQKVQQIHPTADEFAAVQAIDRERYFDALALAGVPTDLMHEPINTVFTAYDGDVDLAMAAAELGVAEPQLAGQIGGLSEDLQPLATGVVSREVFELAFPGSVCDLNLGATPECP